MKKFFSLIILTALISSCKSKFDCFNKSEYKTISKTQLVSIAQKTYTNQAQIRERDEKNGLATDFFLPKIYFDHNCNGQQNLTEIEPIIGALLTYGNLKIRLTGNAEKSELSKNPNISLERAEFLADILKLNGINKSRIIIFDAKSSQPGGIEIDGGNKENRRVDLDIISG